MEQKPNPSEEPDQDLINQIKSAIEVGYRHFDAAEGILFSHSFMLTASLRD
jgi:hypothetical protein